MKHEDKGLLFLTDVVDGSGDKFPRTVVEKAVEWFREKRLQSSHVTEEHGRTIEHIRGYPTGIEMKDDEVHVQTKIDERGKALRTANAEYAMEGVIKKSHMEGDVRVIEDFELRSVAIVRRRVPLKREGR